MSELIFPATLKPTVSKGYGHSSGSNIWRSQVQGGLPRQGRDTYFDPTPISVTMVVSNLGLQTFKAFLKQIHNGASSFQMNHNAGNGIEPHNVLITSEVSYTTQNNNFWQISFTATAERTSLQEDSPLIDALPPLYGIYGDGLNALFKAMTTRVTTYPFINQLPEPEDDPE